jgi:hypothetical protein
VKNETQPSVPPPPDARRVNVLSDTNRRVIYGRVLESVFANPTFQEVLREVAANELENIQTLGVDAADGYPRATGGRK